MSLFAQGLFAESLFASGLFQESSDDGTCLFAQGLFAEGLFANGLFACNEAPAPTPDPTPTQTPAGRSRRRRKYIVEVDGQEFHFDNAQQAFDLLDRAEKLARTQAERQAAEIEAVALPKARLLGKAAPVTIRVPELGGSYDLGIKEAQERIRQIYEDAALAVELRILMALEAERDDEETILFLM